MPIIADIEQSEFENWKVDWILRNLNYLPFSSEEREAIRSELYYDMDQERLQELFELINRNMPEPIESGLSYNQSDINRKLDNVMEDQRK